MRRLYRCTVHCTILLFSLSLLSNILLSSSQKTTLSLPNPSWLQSNSKDGVLGISYCNSLLEKRFEKRSFNSKVNSGTSHMTCLPRMETSEASVRETCLFQWKVGNFMIKAILMSTVSTTVGRSGNKMLMLNYFMIDYLVEQHQISGASFLSLMDHQHITIARHIQGTRQETFLSNQ